MYKLLERTNLNELEISGKEEEEEEETQKQKQTHARTQHTAGYDFDEFSPNILQTVSFHFVISISNGNGLSRSRHLKRTGFRKMIR